MKTLKFEDALKKALIQLSEGTLGNLLEKDLQYQESCEKQSLAENEYLHLNLLKEQRDTVEKLLYWTEINNTDYSVLNYLAGLFDGYKLYELFNIEGTKYKF